MACAAGIETEKYLRVKYFANRPAHDDYYDIAVDIGEVGVENFATLFQEFLVDYLCTKYGDAVADRFCDLWTGERGYSKRKFRKNIGGICKFNIFSLKTVKLSLEYSN